MGFRNIQDIHRKMSFKPIQHHIFFQPACLFFSLPKQDLLLPTVGEILQVFFFCGSVHSREQPGWNNRVKHAEVNVFVTSSGEIGPTHIFSDTFATLAGLSFIFFGGLETFTWKTG